MKTKSTKSSFAPFILVALGVVFLLNNFGFLPWSIWFSLWRFWPILLILIGFEIFVGRQVSFKTIVILFLLIFVAPLILFLNPFGGNPLNTSKINLDQDLGSAVGSKVSIDLPAVNLKVATMATDSAKLYSGQISFSSTAATPIVSKNTTKNIASLSVSQGTGNNIPFLGSIRNEVDLSFSKLVPIDFILKAAAINADLNFSQLNADSLEVETAAGNISIKYPSLNNKTFIKSGAASLTLEIPKAMAAKIVVSGGPKNISIPKERFQENSGTFQTKDFESAKTKITIEIQVGAGTITVK